MKIISLTAIPNPIFKKQGETNYPGTSFFFWYSGGNAESPEVDLASLPLHRWQKW
jgi:hypothetical protein